MGAPPDNHKLSLGPCRRRSQPIFYALWQCYGPAGCTGVGFTPLGEGLILLYPCLHMGRGVSCGVGPQKTEATVRIEAFSFGSIRIDGVTYDHDVVIDGERVRERDKKPSKKYREAFGHTPVSTDENIPWKCRRLVIGTGTGALPVMQEVKREAQRRGVKLLILPTAEAIAELEAHPNRANAILHITC